MHNFFTRLFLLTILLQASVSLGADRSSVEDRLKSCEPGVALAAAEEIVNDPEASNEPVHLFAAAEVLFRYGKKDEAVFWFYAAQLRLRYQLVFDRTGREDVLTMMLMAFGPLINSYAFQDVSNFDRILDQVLEWDKKAPNPFREKPRSEDIDKQIEKIYTGLRDMRAKAFAEKDVIERNARQTAARFETYAEVVNRRCSEEQSDQTHMTQTTKSEWALVVDFVRTNQDVIREAGGIKRVYPVPTTTGSGSNLPDRYIANVVSENRKTVFAVIDVSRSAGDAKFSLACITNLPLVRQGPTKDVCKQ